MPVPTIPGRVRLTRVVGVGGFATVWEGIDPELDSLVAVKVLADNWAHRNDVRARFIGEARMLRRVDSDHVVRVYDIGELDDGRPFLVMTFAAGGSLAEQLELGPLDPRRAIQILRGVADGLRVLHSHGIVHRDVNPNNILFRDDTSHSPVLLADLGLAKDLAAGSGLTQGAGTGDYRAPEQLTTWGTVGPPADVYAYAALIRRVLPASITASAPLVDLLRDAGSEDPDRRPTLGALYAALMAAFGPVRAATGAAPAARGRTRLIVTLAAVVALLAGGAGTLVWLQRGQQVWDPQHRVAITVAGDWLALGTTTLTGTDGRTVDGSSGLVVAAPSGAGRIAVAWAGTSLDAQALATSASHPGCPAMAPVFVRAAGLDGYAVGSTCADGTTGYLDIALRDGRQTVTITATTTGGHPDRSGLLAGLSLG